MFKRAYIFLAVACAIFVFSTLGQAAPKLEHLKLAVNKVAKDSALKTGSFGFCLLDIASNRVLVSRNHANTFVPASNVKGITTATALKKWGADFRFQTYIEHTGKVSRRGTLKGDLFIRGTGDPTLGSKRFGESLLTTNLLESWVKAIKAKGVKRIKGDIVADSSLFAYQSTPRDWLWEDIGNYYGAGAQALNIEENLYTLYLKPGDSVGEPTQVVRTQPALPDIFFFNQITTGAVDSGDNGYIFGTSYTWFRHLEGTIPGGRTEFSIKGSLPDPGLILARWLRKTLVENNIRVRGAATTIRISNKEPRPRSLLYTHQSPTLGEIVASINKESINLFSEALINRLGVDENQVGSTKAGAKAAKAFWQAQGIDVEGMSLKDGSGLSPRNRATPYQLASIFAQAADTRAFVDSLRDIEVKGQEVSKRVKLKTGSMSGVKAYTGYTRDANGNLYTFSILANNYTGSGKTMVKTIQPVLQELDSL